MIRLEQLRYDAGLTPRQLADEVGEMSDQTIRNIEAGTRPHPATAKRLADFFGVTATELLLPALPAATADAPEAA